MRSSTQTWISGFSPCSCSQLLVAERCSCCASVGFRALGVAGAFGPSPLLRSHSPGSLAMQSRICFDQIRAPAPTALAALRSVASSAASCSLRSSCKPLGVVRADGRSRAPALRSCTFKSSMRRVGVLHRRRNRILAQREPRARRIQHAHRLVRQLAVRPGSGATASPPRRPPHPECARRGAFPATSTTPRNITMHVDLRSAPPP